MHLAESTALAAFSAQRHAVAAWALHALHLRVFALGTLRRAEADNASALVTLQLWRDTTRYAMVRAAQRAATAQHAKLAALLSGWQQLRAYALVELRADALVSATVADGEELRRAFGLLRVSASTAADRSMVERCARGALRLVLARWRDECLVVERALVSSAGFAVRQELRATLRAWAAWLALLQDAAATAARRAGAIERRAQGSLLAVVALWRDVASVAVVRAELGAAIAQHARAHALACAWRCVCAYIVTELRGRAPVTSARVQVRRAFTQLKRRSEVTRPIGVVTTGGADHAFARWRVYETLRVCTATRATLVSDYRLLRGLTHALFAWREYSLLQHLFDGWRVSSLRD
ncbi:hypothetical protein T492DRAFT_1105984 [Pavlovales sp. CCMP2436]|nr:hypothetical protein T492DRAFT_1105984 [Pavlovales sp. CCMP2436]